MVSSAVQNRSSRSVSDIILSSTRNLLFFLSKDPLKFLKVRQKTALNLLPIKLNNSAYVCEIISSKSKTF